MALEKNFYQEIQEKEQLWIELINKKLMNIYFFNAELVPFYNKKLEQLNKEYDSTNNKIIGQIIEEIKYIIVKLNEFDETYRLGETIDIKSLIPLFLTSKLNNEKQVDNNSSVVDLSKKEKKLDNNQNIERLQIRKQILNAMKNYYQETHINNELPDYIYDDFPEENIEKNKVA